MKTYKRLLQFAGSIRKYLFPYFLFSLLGSLFGVLNFTLLIPLLNVLFDQNSIEIGNQYAELIPFDWSIDYFTYTFNHYFYQSLIEYGKMGALEFACIAIIFSVFLANFFKYFSQRVLVLVSADMIGELRNAVFNKALFLDLDYFSEQKKGNLMARITTDIQEVENSIGKAFVALFKETFSLIVFFVFLANMSLKLTLFSLLILPLSGGAIALITRRLRKDSKQVQQYLGGLISLLDEVFGSMRVVKSFRAENWISKKFQNENSKYKSSFLKMRFRQELTSPTSEFLGVFVVTGILIYGGSMVISGEGDLTASTFIAFIATFSQVMRPAKSIADAFSGIQRGVASAERVLEIIDSNIRVQPESPIQRLEGFSESIQFKNIGFEYKKGRKVLDGVNFELRKGKTVALVGASGSGKTTIADLLPRFFDPTEGEILIDGVNIKHLPLENLRSLMGIVTQESILFNDSIKENILFGADANMQALENASDIAHAKEFIQHKEEGFDTNVGERGSKLSGGQRQRVSIARAVLNDPPILILDEATSALDNESERLVQQALGNLMKNKTVLVIAHRLTTIQHADEIIVLKRGKIVERGNHQELMGRKEGIYQQLYNQHQDL
jgi:subfamily B ATP-binding cassette protein MsbA